MVLVYFVQGCHAEFTDALPRRNFGQYVEEELVQQRFAGPLVCEEWLQAIFFRFDAVVRLVFLEMEQVFCKHMLCIRVHSMLCSVQALALTEEQGESSLCLLPHLSQNKRLAFLLGGGRLEQHPVKLLICI